MGQEKRGKRGRKEPKKPSRTSKSKKEEGDDDCDLLPLSLPTSFTSREVLEDGSLIYGCRWGGKGKQERRVPLLELIDCYGKGLVVPVVAYDTAADVDYVVEKVVERNGPLYRVRWEGYPAAFDTWEERNALGEHGEALVDGT